MTQFGLQYDVKKLFFDRRAVTSATDRATRKALSKVGAYVRTSARSSMRRGGKKRAVSKPGEAPRVHEGGLKRLLFFAYEPMNQSVVIGPVRYADSAAGLLEFGGTKRARNRMAKGQQTTTKTYRARPYMGPALMANMQQIPAAFRGSIGG